MVRPEAGALIRLQPEILRLDVALSDTHTWKVWVGVGCGAFLGTQARYLLGLAVPETSGSIPWTTLAVNIAGSLVLGYLTARWFVRPAPFWLRAAVGPGILGSFTTFSSVMLALTNLSTDGSIGLAATYLALSLLLGLGAAAGGLALGKRTTQEANSG